MKYPKTLHHLLFVVITLFSTATIAESKPVLRSSVSKEFINGLQFKYLQFIAQQMDLKLEIMPMPFARRVRALEQGSIDIMVGMMDIPQKRSSALSYLMPNYESINYLFYVRKNDLNKLTKASDLEQLVIGVTIDDQLISENFGYGGMKMFQLSTLKQKIRMLNQGRIDGFTHFEGSTRRMLKTMQLEDKIVPAKFQSQSNIPLVFALSNSSPLIDKKQEFERVIKKAKSAGIFAKIRADHYKNKAQSKK